MKRLAVLLYGVVCYTVFFGVFLYLFGFLANLFVPTTVSGESTVPVALALSINIALMALFGLQHSVMARPTFKNWWTRFVPRPIERPTYVMATNLVLITLFLLWQPIDITIWHAQSTPGKTILWSLFGAGWMLVFISTWLINHFDLFGLRQVWTYFRGKEYTNIKFRTPGPYKMVRHPLYVGWIMAFWFTPMMSLSHLVFAATGTVYIVIAIYFEERNLVEYHGRDYEQYRKRVPMLVPNPFHKPKREAAGKPEAVAST